MKDKDTELIWEAYDAPGGRPENAGFGSSGNIPDDEIRDRGIHDRPDAGQPLSDYGLKIEPAEEEDREGGQRHELWVIRPINHEAREEYGPPQNGYDAYDWVYQGEFRNKTLEELEQIVINSIHNHGKPRFFRPYAQQDTGQYSQEEYDAMDIDDPRHWQNSGAPPPGY
jgi:hypothetical protein